MIVVEYIKLKKAEIDFKIEYIKYFVWKKRLARDLKKIDRVYPDSESIDAIPNKKVISNHKYLENTVTRLGNSCFDKMDICNGMRIEFLENLID